MFTHAKIQKIERRQRIAEIILNPQLPVRLVPESESCMKMVFLESNQMSL